MALLANLLLLSLGLTWEAIRLRPTLETTLRDSHTTVLEIGLTAANLRKASLEWEKSSKAQAEQSTKLLKDSTEALTRVSLLVSHADTALNQKMIPSISTAIENEDRALLSAQTKLGSNLDAMLAATQQLQKTLADADAVIADPKVKESVDSLADATKHASEATEHLSGITAAGERTANYYEKRLTTPQSFVKTVVQAILQLGSQARILFSH